MKTGIIRTLVIALVCVLLVGGTVYALVIGNRSDIANKPVNVITINDGIALMSDKMSHNDISRMTEIITDEEGNLVDNYRELRQKYVYEMDRFQILGQDGGLKDADSTPFTVTLHSHSEGIFDYTFYKITVDGKSIAAPSEWDVMPFLFLVDENADNFFACTDIGIYRIDPVSQSASLISSEEYNGSTYFDLLPKYYETGGWHLSWISNPVLSPDGQWVAFQSNRNDVESLPSSSESLWILNTKTGEEKMIPMNNEYTPVPKGFLSQNGLFIANVSGKDGVDATYSVVDIYTANIVQVDLEQLPNVHIDDVSRFGFIALQTYEKADISERIYRISDDGKCSLVAEINGNLHYVRFSPDGKSAVGVLRDEKAGDTVLIIDISTGKSISEISVAEDSYVSGLTWAGNERFIVTENSAINGRIQENSWMYTLKGE